jgi:ankyrin repeat protein
MFQSPNPPQQARSSRSIMKQYFDHEMQDSMTALHIFCRSGSRHRDIKTIVEIQPQLISHPTPNGGDTPLHFAVAAHDLDTTRLLLKVDPHVANIKSGSSGHFGSQMTPLHVAISENASPEIIALLVNASPRSLKLRNGDGFTPQQLAVQCCRAEDMKEVLSCLTIPRGNSFVLRRSAVASRAA